jgi:hypothetical protein
MHFFSVLKNGKDFSADLDRKRLRLASLPFKLCTSFRVLGDGRRVTASDFYGQALIPSLLTT